jgi:HD superfamily phosphodiesterase
MKEHFEAPDRDRLSEVSPSVLEVLKLEMALPEAERRDSGNDVENERQRLIIEKAEVLSPAELAQVDEFRRKKVEVIYQNSLRYQDLMRIFKNEGRVLGKENANWRAVTRHSLVAELVSGELAKTLNERGETVDETAVRVSALLHDLTKRQEYSDEAKAYEASGQGDRYDFGSKKQDELFSHDDVRTAIAQHHPDIEKIKRLSQAVGIGVMRRGQPGEHLDTLEEKIIFYVDKILKHSAVVSLAERMADVAKRYTHGKANEELEYTQKVERELASSLGIQPEDMPDFIQTLIVKRINQHENPRS